MDMEVKITEATKKEELVQIISDIIWENKGIDSYSILDKLIKLGYKFTTKKEFMSLLYSVDRNYDTISANDSYLLFKKINVQALIYDFEQRRNCYDCHFLKQLDSDYRLEGLLGGSSNSSSSEDKKFCALNPLINIKLAMNYIPKECPINNAIKEQQEQQGQRN